VVTSKFSAIPDGGVIEFLALFPYKPSTSDLSAFVVSDGAAIRLALALYSPPCASTGALVFTPAKAVIPAVAPTDDENLHVYDNGSNAVATL